MNLSLRALAALAVLLLADAGAAHDGAAHDDAAHDDAAQDEAAPVAVAPPAPRLRFVYRTLNVARFNPVGLITDNVIGMRLRMFPPDDLLFKDTFVGIAFTPQASPAFARAGVLVEVQPITPIRVWAAYDVAGYFGFFDLFQSFPSPNADFSETALSARGELGEDDPLRNYATYGTQLTIGLDLQVKLGPVAARNLTRVVRGDYRLRTGDRVYYDLTYDVLAPNRGAFVNNDTDLLWVSDFGLIAGLRANATAPLYGPVHFDEKEGAGSLFADNGPTLRGGPIVVYTFFDGEGGWVSKPSVIATVQWYAAHRWRTGADVNQLVPYALLGFAMSGDLLPWR
jgi:hypothetical protein